MRIQLTDRFVKAAKASAAPQADFFDADTPGLCLRVSKSGRKAWNFVFTSPKDGKRARLSIGLYPAVGLAAARGRALEARGHVEAVPPKDPRDVRLAEETGAMTVGALVESYLDKHVRPNLRSAAEAERRFRRSVIPVIGSVKVGELHRRDMNRVTDPILARESPVEAARTFEDLRALLSWAVKRGDIDHSPMAGMAKPAKAIARDRVLSPDEINTLWHVLPKALARSKSCQRVLKLCLVTAQRVGEVSGMAISELDVKKRVWQIPAVRSKNGHAHMVPLSALALSLIEEAMTAAGKGAKFVFLNNDEKGPLPAGAIARTVARANIQSKEHPAGRFGISHWTAHDLRRTAVSEMAALGISPIVLGHVINHRSVTKAGVTLSVYSHYDFQKERREALKLWASRLEAVIGGGAASGVPLKATKKSTGGSRHGK